MRLAVLPSFVLLIGLAVRPVFGQTAANGSIRGDVRDATGAVLPDTSITAPNPTLSIAVTVASDNEGHFRILEQSTSPNQPIG
jgi:hypothetical protein